MKTPIDLSPAFPSTNTSNGGMTLRDYFAAKAMPELMSRLTASDLEAFKYKTAKIVGELAYAFADAMLEVRKQ